MDTSTGKKASWQQGAFFVYNTHVSIDLKDKTILITGANGGIGSILASILQKEDANLILLGGDNCQYNVDLADKKQVHSFINTLGETKIDAIINVAGIGIYKSILDLTEDEWEQSLNVNLTAPFLLTKHLIKNLKDSDISLVMNVGSGMGVIPVKDRTAYCSSKFGLRGLTLSLVEEYKESKPHFCLITLGSTITNFGGSSAEDKQKHAKDGKAYFPVEFVANKLVEIIKNENRDVEYTLYPGDYGFGKWVKP